MPAAYVGRIEIVQMVGRSEALREAIHLNGKSLHGNWPETAFEEPRENSERIVVYLAAI